MFTYYQDKHLYYFRKPAGMPSTFGKQPSFLDYLLQHQQDNTSIQSLFSFFWREKELWLLNRLDNETSGLLYFAKNPRVYKDFKQLQTNFLLHKYYLVQVYGDIAQVQEISYPIAHHKFNPDRMVVIKHPSDIKKTKWTLHHLVTEIVEFEYLPTSNTSILLIRIQKGIRHQIRAHLASIGHPICGDNLYSKSAHKNYDNLQLFSIGLESI